MAILDYHGTLPDNHPFIDLVAALELVSPLEQSLKGRILKYEGLQTICSIDKYSLLKRLHSNGVMTEPAKSWLLWIRYFSKILPLKYCLHFRYGIY